MCFRDSVGSPFSVDRLHFWSGNFLVETRSRHDLCFDLERRIRCGLISSSRAMFESGGRLAVLRSSASYSQPNAPRILV
jgi:hypothetical protein